MRYSRVNGRTSRDETDCCLQGRQLELVVEVAGVGEDRAVRIDGKWPRPKTLRLPVAVMKTSPIRAAASAFITR